MRIIRLKRGDEIVGKLEEFLAKEKIYSGFIAGIGAVSSAELMLYKLGSKQYFSKKIKGEFEIASFSAVITRGIDKEVMIHPHIIICDKSFRSFGGHLKQGIVAATFEAVILKSSEKVERYFDKTIGLNLIK